MRLRGHRREGAGAEDVWNPISLIDLMHRLARSRVDAGLRCVALSVCVLVCLSVSLSAHALICLPVYMSCIRCRRADRRSRPWAPSRRRTPRCTRQSTPCRFGFPGRKAL